MTQWWVGAYGADMNGTALGIEVLASRPDGSLEPSGLAASADSASYLHRRGDRLWAAEEGTGQLAEFVISQSSLTLVSRTPTGGTWPCHIAHTGELVTVANYFDGTIGVIEGSRLIATIPPDTQDEPHAHATFALDPTTLLSLDLGADRVYVHEVTVHEVDGSYVTRVGSLDLPRGTGPRDIVRHPSGLIYVLGELGGTVIVLRWHSGVLSVVASVDVPGAQPGDHGSAISFGPGGYVYTALRGSNRIAVLHASDDGATLTPLGSVSCEGDWPRHHAVDGDLLHVANQLSDSVATFRLGGDGMPRHIATTSVASPTFLLAVPHDLETDESLVK